MSWRDTAALLKGDIDWPEFKRRNPNDPFTAIAIYAQQQPYEVAYFIMAAVKKAAQDTEQEE